MTENHQIGNYEDQIKQLEVELDMADKNKKRNFFCSDMGDRACITGSDYKATGFCIPAGKTGFGSYTQSVCSSVLKK